MDEINYQYAAFLPPDNIKCPICGREPMQHVKRCGKAAARVCEEHCQTCTDYDNRLSIGVCHFNRQKSETEEFRNVVKETKKKLMLRGIQMVFQKEKQRYIVFRPWGNGEGSSGRYDVYAEKDVFSAWDCFLTAVDKSARFEIKSAIKEKRIPEIEAEMRGVKLWRSEGGVWYISRKDRPEDIAAENDPLEAWVRFWQIVDLLMRKSIRAVMKTG